MGEARTVMDAMTRAMFDGDMERAKSMYSTDAIGVAPDGSEFKGGHEIVEFLSPFFRAFPDAEYQAIAQLESDKTAIDEGIFTGTHTEPMEALGGETIPPTNKRISMRSCDVATVEGGKITEHHFYFDMLSMLEQLGISPS
ncbi:MAG TPA: ester cyclase [Actinomycetota bacterium]|nr:ester cyclase [Actinomycetota bacterium]